MTTKPTWVGKKMECQEPAPPIPRPLPDPPLNTFPAVKPPRLFFRHLQRQHYGSRQWNTLQTAPFLHVEWVMEDEVEDPAGDTFLHWPTRRAFIHDRLQLRVQVERLVIRDGVKIKLALIRMPVNTANGPVLFIGSEQSDVKHFAGKPTTAIHRQVKRRNNVGQISTKDGEKAIYWEPVSTDKRSFILTTVKLPHITDDINTDSHRYVLSCTITQDGSIWTANSPPIEAVRWWARSKDNLGMHRRKADSMEPLVDETCFQAYYDEINAAVAGNEIYLAGWSFNPFTLLSGGKNAVEDASNAGSPSDITKMAVLRRLAEAAKRGAKVYILLDSLNWPRYEPWVNNFLSVLSLPPTARAKIKLRHSAHPKMQKVGIGLFSEEIQFSSYHEKYMIVKGSRNVAIVGGIDCEPKCFSPFKHEWKHFFIHYYKWVCRIFGLDPSGSSDPQQKAVLRLFTRRGEQFKLWHDADIKVTGSTAISGICADFIRRWNEGGGSLVQSSVDAEEKDVEWDCQLVKTDHLKDGTSLNTTSGDHFGTWDSHRVAILEARHYIYIENQYCRSPIMRDALIKALKSNPLLQVMVIVPFITEETAAAGTTPIPSANMFNFGAYNKVDMWRRGYLHGDYLQHEFLTQLREAAPDRVAIACLAGVAKDYIFASHSFVDKVQMIYPHSKTMIVDDTWAYIGSANANGRGLRLDGEIGYVVHDRKFVTKYRKQLWLEHFGVTVETRDIRKFMNNTWKALMIKGKNKPIDATEAELATVKVLELKNPRKGQKYDGPGSWLESIDDYV